MYTKNLDDYVFHKNSRSCSLDGKYFNRVFENYPGLVREPLTITIKKGPLSPGEKFYIDMKETKLNTEMPGLLRLIIETPTGKHCNLLILDYEGGKVYRFEPLGKYQKYFEKVNELIKEYLGMYFDFFLQNIKIDFYEEILDVKNPNCRKSGFSTAYVILYAYAFLHQKDYNPTKILKFVDKIECVYS